LLEGNRLIRHDLHNYVLLSRLGHKVPNPLLDYYDWPHPPDEPPFQAQRGTFNLLTSNTRGYVLNDLGTGKTRSAIWAWDALNKHGVANKLLVVCNVSTMEFTWKSELFSIVPNRKAVVLHGTKAKRLERLSEDADVYIINHDGLRVIFDELMVRNDIDTLIIDELATYRNNTSRTKMMAKFAPKFQWAWGLTGRPMPRAPTDVWSQCRVLTPHSVPKRFTVAREMLMTRWDTWTWKPRPDAKERAFGMMQPSVRYTLDDVIELPDAVTHLVNLPLPSHIQKVYDGLAKSLTAMVASHQITAVNAAVAMGKLLQISCGWVYSSDSTTVNLNNQIRLDWLLDTLEEAEHKVICFVPYRHAVEGLYKEFESRPDEYPHDSFAMVHGDVKPSQRNNIFTRFQSDDRLRVLLAHPVCMAHGLTLTAADTIIWYCPPTSLEVYEQANARIRRIGQKHRQQFYLMQGTPVEKKIYKLLRTNQLAQDALLAMFADATQD